MPLYVFLDKLELEMSKSDIWSFPLEGLLPKAIVKASWKAWERRAGL